MNKEELNTEQIILEAAEAEFLEKGYAGAKMTAIAKRANVAHSMLHYYFRSKENLFKAVFLKKAQTMFPIFEGTFERSLSFSEVMQTIIETQFDFVAKNPKLPLFILSEILSNKANRALLMEVLMPKVSGVAIKLKEMMDKEIKKGTIRPILLHNLVLNMLSMNISTFLALPIMQDTMTQNSEEIENMLNERKESNVQFILAALRP